MVNSFLVSLDTLEMINILYEMIKILPEKMLNAIDLRIKIHQRKISH